MSNISEVNLRNKRIAKNTLFLYFRMLLNMIVRLYTSRIMLEALGITDYGIYNVVGGIVGFFTIFSSSLSISISRFLSVLVGKKDEIETHKVFCSSIIIQIVMAITLGLIIGIVGLWLLNNKLIIPVDRMYAAHWVLLFSITTFVIKLLSVPYNAIIIAHERMSAFAYISIIEIILTLVITYALFISPIDKLVLYAFLIAVLSLAIRIIYASYCHRNFVETRFEFFFDKDMLKDLSHFIGWTFCGNSMLIIRDQGTNILLNIFCGPIINAARGIALQVDKAVYGFVTNFLMAVHPQITKSYSSGDLNSMHELIIRATKFSFFIMLLLLMPLYANIHYILNLWLIDVPPHTEAFVVLILFYSLINCFFHPLYVSILAQGDIKRYEVIYSLLLIINIVLIFVILKMGMTPEWCFVVNIIINLFVVIVQLVYTKIKICFPTNRFFKENLLRTFPIFILSLVFVYIAPVRECNTFPILLLDTLLILIFVGMCVIMFGITKGERMYIWEFIKNKLSNCLVVLVRK